jgi:hypothetical protein
MRAYCFAWVSLEEAAKCSSAWIDRRVHFSRTRPKLPRRPTPRTRDDAKSQDLETRENVYGQQQL